MASRLGVTGFPLVGWGIALIVGLTAIDLLTGVPRVVVAVVAWLIGIVLSWLPLRVLIRTGTEGRVRLAWAAVLIASPFLVSAAHPQSAVHMVLLLAGLWGLAMCLYAIATHDWVFATVAALGVITAGLVAIPGNVPHPLMIIGVVNGVSLLTLGIYRVQYGLRHV